VEIPTAKGAVAGWKGWGRNDEMRTSDVLRDLLITEFVKHGAGKIRMVERGQIDQVRKELAFGNSDEVDPKTAAGVGKLLGAQYIVTGKITRFSTKSSGFSTGVVGKLAAKVGGSGGVSADLGVKTKKGNFSGRLDMRIVNVETGEILASINEEGTASNVSVSVLGVGNEIVYDDSLVNVVFEPLVKKIAPQLIGQFLTLVE
jgi:curli biogenesis system outer membrane secretion channel CsgG